MAVGDAQAHAVEAAGAQRAQELAPERLGLDLADVEADHLAPAGLVHAVGDHQRLRRPRAPRSRTFSILASSHRYG